MHQLKKLELRVRNLVSQLENCSHLEVHRLINQSFHMQKAEELKFIEEQLSEAEYRLQQLKTRKDFIYTLAYHQWRKDVRYFLHLQHPKQPASPSSINL